MRIYKTSLCCRTPLIPTILRRVCGVERAGEGEWNPARAVWRHHVYGKCRQSREECRRPQCGATCEDVWRRDGKRGRGILRVRSFALRDGVRVQRPCGSGVVGRSTSSVTMSSRLAAGIVIQIQWPYPYGINCHMKKTLNIDDKLFSQAKQACGATTDTETIRLGLEALVRHATYERIRALLGSEPHARPVTRRRERASKSKRKAA